MGQVNRHLSRVLAVQGLYQFYLLKCSREDAARCDWDFETPVDEETKAYASVLINGTIEKTDEVQESIRRHLQNREIDDIKTIDKSVLFLSVYSLLFLRDIPGKVVINEAVILAKQFGNTNSYKFINGILDAIQKDTAAV
jgi:N utilization substance protein B